MIRKITVLGYQSFERNRQYTISKYKEKNVLPNLGIPS